MFVLVSDEEERELDSRQLLFRIVKYDSMNIPEVDREPRFPFWILLAAGF